PLPVSHLPVSDFPVRSCLPANVSYSSDRKIGDRNMHLIDGNNVIGQRVGWHRDKPGSRRRLMQDLARLAQAKKLRLTVVFDGAPDPQFPDGSSYRGVKIFYSRQGSDADARIIEMVEAERNKKNLVVVTSDRKLTSQIRVNGVR